MIAFGEMLGNTRRESVTTFKLLSRSKIGLFGLTLTLLIVVLAFVGPYVWPPEESANVDAINQGPSAQYWLGTDFQGQDNLRKVINGGKYISSTLAEQLVAEIGSDSPRPSPERLSEREFQVLRKIAQGKTIGQIAEEMTLSVKTVSTYRTRLLLKMKMKTNAELVRYAVQHGLVDFGE